VSDVKFFLPLEVQVASLNRSTKDVYYLLKRKSYRASEIQRKTNYSARTIRTALRQLLEMNLVVRIPNLADMRSSYYQITLSA
jgi:DNA-binding MarR family transcriptional regulator